METILGLQFGDLSPQQLNALVVIIAAIGTLYCFLGYRTLKFLVGLTGFLLAGAVAGLIAAWISEGHVIATIISAGIGGIAGAMALFFVYKAGIFCLGLLGASLVAHNVLSTQSNSWIPLAVLGLGVVGGLVALLVERPVMTLATSALGAYVVVFCVTFFLMGAEEFEAWAQPLEFHEHRLAILASWTVLALAGVLAQFATHKNSKPKKE